MLPVIIADPIAVQKGRRRGLLVSPPLTCTRPRCIGSPSGATSTTTPNSIKDGCKWSQMDSPCLPSMECIKFGAQGLLFSRRGSAPHPSPYPPLDSHTCQFEGPVPDPSDVDPGSAGPAACQSRVEPQPGGNLHRASLDWWALVTSSPNLIQLIGRSGINVNCGGSL